MADTKVHLFPDLATPLGDTKLAGQTPGGGANPEAFEVSLDQIRDFCGATGLRRGKVIAETATANIEKQVPIPAGSLVSKIIINSTASGTVNVGSTSGGTDIHEAEPYANGARVSLPSTYFTNAGTLFFSGHTHALTLKIILDYA